MKSIVLFLAFLSLIILLPTDTFGQKLWKIDFAKKIAEATPATLPQSPTEKKISNDVLDEGLKGKVKSVVHTTLYPEKIRPESYEDKYYNESGNLVKSVDYSEGYPQSVTVYGYIDKMRVTRSKDVEYAKGERLKSKAMILSIRAEDNTRDPSAPRDERYDMREIRLYDSQGRLIEKRSHQNNGEMSNKKTYEYEGNRRLERSFGFDGNQWSRAAFIVDAAGNDIEENWFDANDKISDRRLMIHEFDDKGNWIVERTYEEKTVRKKKVRKLLWTSYRKIFYYP